MMNCRLLFYPTIVMLLALCSCSQVNLDELESGTDKCKVTFRLTSVDHIPFDKGRGADVSEFCTRISIGIFKEGTKVKEIDQSLGDGTTFGTLTYELSPGIYQIVCVAHNGTGNCKITHPEQITFHNSKVTDTFYTILTDTIESSTTMSLELERPVSMFRLCITAPMPSNVVQMQFAMTGGATSFNATTGFGNTSAKQNEVFAITSDMYGKPSTFELYTFPKTQYDFINLTVTAVDSTNNVVDQHEYKNYSIMPNVITQHTESFFSQPLPTESSITVANDGKWSSVYTQ